MGTLSTRTFGNLADGSPVQAVDLEGEGIRVTVISFGATLQAVHVPDRDGRMADVTLGHDELADYEAQPHYFGSSVGRYANRIAGASFTLDGTRHRLAANAGPNCLHSGPTGCALRNWTIVETRETPAPAVTLRYVSPDGEGGFPGRLTITARYELTGPGELTVRYEATTDRPTVVNMTNHAYFNLAGMPCGRDVLGHRLEVAADEFLPDDETMIPTGEVRPVEGTPFDFREPHAFAERIRDGRDGQILGGRGYDHCYVLRGGVTEEPRFAARAEEETSGRVLELSTTAPGLQVYTGNFLDGTAAGKGGRAIRQSDGFCLEAQHFPDAPNRPSFPSTRLDPGETYRQVTVYRFSAG